MMENSMRSQILLLASLLLPGVLLPAQTPAVPTAQPAGSSGQALPVELSVPFGAEPGKLVASGNSLIFIDDQNPAASFVVSRENIQDISLQDGIVVMQLRQPLRQLAGQPNTLTFRLLGGNSPEPLLSWAKTPIIGQAPVYSYNAKVDGSSGRFIIAPDRLAYESVTNYDMSRQWAYSDIKEIKKESPYKLRITPFHGDPYTIELIGTPIDPATYNEMWIASRPPASRKDRLLEP
jgi:hypothetical protein